MPPASGMKNEHALLCTRPHLLPGVTHGAYPKGTPLRSRHAADHEHHAGHLIPAKAGPSGRHRDARQRHRRHRAKRRTIDWQGVDDAVTSTTDAKEMSLDTGRSLSSVALTSALLPHAEHTVPGGHGRAHHCAGIPHRPTDRCASGHHRAEADRALGHHPTGIFGDPWISIETIWHTPPPFDRVPVLVGVKAQLKRMGFHQAHAYG
jgi:hypothetical protein